AQRGLFGFRMRTIAQTKKIAFTYNPGLMALRRQYFESRKMREYPKVSIASDEGNIAVCRLGVSLGGASKAEPLPCRADNQKQVTAPHHPVSCSRKMIDEYLSPL